MKTVITIVSALIIFGIAIAGSYADDIRYRVETEKFIVTGMDSDKYIIPMNSLIRIKSINGQEVTLKLVEMNNEKFRAEEEELRKIAEELRSKIKPGTTGDSELKTIAENLLKKANELKDRKIIDGNTVAQEGGTYKFGKYDDLRTFCSFYAGWHVSALTLPFKIYTRKGNPFQKSSTLSGSVNINSAVGYTKTSWTVPILFAGLTSITTNDVNDTSGKKENYFGLSVGIGTSYAFTDNLQIGFFVGSDQLFGGTKWRYEHRPWYSLGIGYKFFEIGGLK